MPPISLLHVTTVGSAILLGFFWPLFRHLQEPLSQRLKLEGRQLSWLNTCFTLVLVPTFLVCGLLQDRLGGQEVLFMGTLATALGTALLAVALKFQTALLAVLCLGIGGGCLSIGCTTLIPRAWGPAGSPAAALNLGFTIVTACTLLAAPAINFLFQKLGFRHGVLFLALSCLIPATFTALTPVPDFPPAQPNGPSRHLFQQLPFLLLAFVFVFYWFLEWSFPLWLPRYLPELGYRPRSAKYLVAAFWVMFLGIRCSTFWLLGSGYEAWFLVPLVFLAAVFFGNLVGVYVPTSGGVGFLMLALCLGPILPTLLGIGLILEPKAPATVMGLLFAFSTLASFFEMPFVNAFAGTHSARITMRIPMVLALIMTVPLLVLALLG